MYKVSIVIAILGFASSALAVSCYYGTTYDGSNPSTTASGCWSCTKSVTRYTYGSTTTTQTYYTGTGCTTFPSLSSVLNAATASLGAGLTSVSLASTCSAYTVYNPSASVASVSNALNSVGTNLNNLVNSAVGSTVSCSASSTSHSCGSGYDSGSYSTCVCCGENCNSSGFKCGAASMSASALTMLIFGLVGYFMRQQ